MGRKAKKFIDKKKAATFQLLSRDSADPNFAADAPGGDRIFVRVDDNPYSVETLDGCDDKEDPDSRFADAPEEAEGGYNGQSFGGSPSGQVSDKLRKEILELGFPDDGYNYLLHLREIRNAGGGSAFYQNPKTRLDLVPKDVKAYDASKVMVSGVNAEPNDDSIYDVASHSVDVRVQKVFDPEVAALLDDSDMSRFGSDIEDLEEDFVVQANYCESGDVTMGQKLNLLTISKPAQGALHNPTNASVHREMQATDIYEYENNEYAIEQPRARRLLDEQFDLLERQEYGSDYKEEGDNYYNGYDDDEEESLADKLKQSLNDKVVDELDIDSEYKAPADILREKDQLKSKELEASAEELINRCREYAEKYQKEDEDDKEVMIVDESSDESEVWDCETIVSTYSKLDNHPKKIDAPGIARRRLLSAAVSGALAANNQVISLKGKQKLPVEFLPNGRKPATEKVKSSDTLRPEAQKRKQESKEEKKERKSAVKEEKREARRKKKEIKEVYKCEAQRAQRVAAINGPSSIPLM